MTYVQLVNAEGCTIYCERVETNIDEAIDTLQNECELYEGDTIRIVQD